MATYKAPLRDMRFVLNEVLDIGTISSLPKFGEVTPDLVDAVLEEAAKICEQVLFPINRSGDEEGCTFENGVVRTPAGFKEAYRTFVEGGWTNLSTDPQFGGQGLPATVGFVVEEMICSANLAFGMYPGLSHGAYEAIRHHANDDIRQTYLTKLGEGTWSGTMCLTEPHCGTDLGMLRTRAEPAADGSYRITGTKIFISAGEHDLTENIIHLVLARLPDAPGGTKGISLFVVPKFLPDAGGKPGKRNGLACGAIEHKMGIKASPTCVINFDGAQGWLVGEANKGLNAMFTMMNAARLGVGMQGLGLAETAYQSAVAYARERLQGRSLSGPKTPDKPADPIIVHPDVRRMLLTQKSFSEGARALAYWVGMLIDVARHSDDAGKREEADDLLQLLTPVVKAYFTDSGFEAANLAVQVHGGHGYIREHGVEQLVRDARITMLYEGANGIQALDLVGRKLPMHGGRPMQKMLALLHGFVAENKGDAAMAEFVGPLEKAVNQMQGAVMWLMQNAMRNHEEAGGAATDFLKIMALTVMAYMWSRIAKSALAGKANGGDDGFYDAKLATGRFFIKRILPQADAAYSALQSGVEPMMALKAEAF